MTELLIKLFITKKDIKNQEKIDKETREKYGVLASFVGIISNVLLFISKLVIGIILGSVSIIADSFNNLSDTASSIITFVGFKIGNKPADKEHPFGHGRIEYIAALAVSFIILMIGVEFFRTSFDKVLHPTKVEFKTILIAILLGTMLVKIWLSRFNKKIGETINSQALLATSKDAFNDVLVTSATIFSILVTKFTGLTIDGYIGILVSIILIKSGFDIAKDTLNPLLGESYDPILAKNIENMLKSYDGILGTHDLIVHNYGPNVSMASIHAEVSIDAKIDESHEVIDKAEKEIAEKFGVYLVIHMDPVAVNDERIMKISEIVKNISKEYDNHITAHDFKIIDGNERINFIFDLVVPYDIESGNISEILKKIKTEAKLIDKKYTCIINVESGFSGR